MLDTMFSSFVSEFGSGNFFTLPDGTTFITSVRLSSAYCVREKKKHCEKYGCFSVEDKGDSFQAYKEE